MFAQQTGTVWELACHRDEADAPRRLHRWLARLLQVFGVCQPNKLVNDYEFL